MTTDKTPPPTARLVSFYVHPEHRLPPPLQHNGLVHVDSPGQLAGWGVEVRGATMFLVSPPGWTNSVPAVQWKKDGPRTVYGPIPLAHVTLIWQGAAPDVDKLQRYSLPEMKLAKPAAETAPTIDPKEIGDP